MATILFYSCMELFMPTILVVDGIKMITHPEKKISCTKGYHTYASLRSQRTWDFAQRAFGKLSVRTGVLFLFIDFIMIWIQLQLDEKAIAISSLLNGVLQICMVIVCILLTEIALQKEFKEEVIQVLQIDK